MSASDRKARYYQKAISTATRDEDQRREFLADLFEQHALEAIAAHTRVMLIEMRVALEKEREENKKKPLSP